jgi:hypothetical protein
MQKMEELSREEKKTDYVEKLWIKMSKLCDDVHFEVETKWERIRKWGLRSAAEQTMARQAT